jgi:hypothetical protein
MLAAQGSAAQGSRERGERKSRRCCDQRKECGTPLCLRPLGRFLSQEGREAATARLSVDSLLCGCAGECCQCTAPQCRPPVPARVASSPLHLVMRWAVPPPRRRRRFPLHRLAVARRQQQQQRERDPLSRAQSQRVQQPVRHPRCLHALLPAARTSPCLPRLPLLLLQLRAPPVHRVPRPPPPRSRSIWRRSRNSSDKLPCAQRWAMPSVHSRSKRASSKRNCTLPLAALATAADGAAWWDSKRRMRRAVQRRELKQRQLPLLLQLRLRLPLALCPTSPGFAAPKQTFPPLPRRRVWRPQRGCRRAC